MTTTKTPSTRSDKCYVLIRDDLYPADQAVQAGHALAQLAAEHPKEHKEWVEESEGILVYLNVPGNHINKYIKMLENGGIVHSVFVEPDPLRRTSDELMLYHSTHLHLRTAIAVAPNWLCEHVLFKDLPLAFSQDGPEIKPRKRWWKR
jgi:hypothetical protein